MLNDIFIQAHNKNVPSLISQIAERTQDITLLPLNSFIDPRTTRLNCTIIQLEEIKKSGNNKKKKSDRSL